MDDLLIIILTLVVAVIGAFGRKKKKEANQSQSAGGTQQPQDFWDMFMNQGEQQQHQPQFIYEDEPEEAPEEKIVVEKKERPKYSFSAEEEGKSDIKEELIKSLDSERKKVQIEGEDFSLRKAVIYSEILNRKYT